MTMKRGAEKLLARMGFGEDIGRGGESGRGDHQPTPKGEASALASFNNNAVDREW